MTFRNKSFSVGDLVETVYIVTFKNPTMIGVVVGFPEVWKNRKVSVYWNDIGIRYEWINDIRRVDTE